MSRGYDIEVSRTLRAPLADVDALLTPEAIVRYDGSHRPKDVRERNGRIIVTAWPAGSGLEPRYVFETDGDRIRYRRDGVRPPLVAVETTLRLEERPDDTAIRLRSVVEPPVPLPVLGRVIAWRRRRQLEGFCDRLAIDLARTRVGDEK